MLRDYIGGLIAGLEDLTGLQQQLDAACTAITGALSGGAPVLVCGNGGSAADAQHLAAELVGRFETERPARNVICLSANAAILTAIGNDYGFEEVFARQVKAHGREGGVLIAISTSGASENVIRAANVARRTGMSVIAMTGRNGLASVDSGDIVLKAPSDVTAHVQEMHVVLYHVLCRMIDEGMAV